MQCCSVLDPDTLTVLTGQAEQVVAVLVSPLYVESGQLTHESPERIKPAPHSLVQPALKEPDHPASHTQAEEWLLPVTPSVLVWNGQSVQNTLLPPDGLNMFAAHPKHITPSWPT
jgi:hypothetical protein